MKTKKRVQRKRKKRKQRGWGCRHYELLCQVWRIALARLSVHGAGYQVGNVIKAWGAWHQSIGSHRQATRYRLQLCQKFARQVEGDAKMIKAIDRLPDKKTMTERIVKKIMQTKKRLKL